MKHVVTALTLAGLAALTSVAHAADAGAPAGSIEKASTFAAGNAATAVAVGVGAATVIAVTVIGAEGGGNTATSTATATAQ